MASRWEDKMTIATKLAFGIIFVMLLALPGHANDGVAKVIILKGTVEATNLDGSKQTLKKGMWLKEGARVVTQAKSFAKLLFIDKSSMNVGPNSEMKIKEFPKSEAGIIQLMKGQIRSKVTKDYMNMKDKNKSKLFIKTKTAAMGVRGTDFQVNYNPVNEATSLVTFEGNVAMAQLTNLGDIAVTQNNLEQIVSSDQAVEVKKGQYSGASPKTPRATLPIKISPVQLETLKATEVPGVSAAEANSEGEGAKAGNKPPPPPKKTFRNVIPPGVDAKAFSNEAKEIDGAMASTVGADVVQEVKQEVAREAAVVDAPPPEGMVNPATGEIAPPAGGFIDLGTAQYVPPPPGSQFDPNAGVFIPPPSLGTVDPETGGFKNDHYDLTPDGKFVPKPVEVVANDDSAGGPNDGRGPASERGPEGGPNDGPNDGPKDGPREGGPQNGPPGGSEASGPTFAEGGPRGPEGSEFGPGPEGAPLGPEGTPPPGMDFGAPSPNGEFSADAPPPPPPEITVVAVIGMDSADMAEFEAQLAPPPPPPELTLEAPPPPEENTADLGPAPDGTQPPPGDDGRAPASDGPVVADDGTKPPPGEEGAPPPEGGEFGPGPESEFADFGEPPPVEFDEGEFEQFAENTAEDLVEDVTEEFQDIQEQLDQIENSRTIVDFNIIVQ